MILAARARAVSATLVVSLAFLIGSVLINAEAWWARYAPQLWLVPLTVAMFVDATKLSRVARAVSIVLLVVLTADAAFMAMIASGYAAFRTHKGPRSNRNPDARGPSVRSRTKIFRMVRNASAVTGRRRRV